MRLNPTWFGGGAWHLLPWGAVLSAVLTASPARAEDWIHSVEFGGGTGLEGAAVGTGNIGWRRARTRIVAGLDLRWDENQRHVYGARVFAEVERRGGVGALLRYGLWPGPKLGFYGELGAVAAPESLLGGGVGAEFLIPLGERTHFFLSPSFTAFPVGSDLATETVLMWGLLTVGARVDI